MPYVYSGQDPWFIPKKDDARHYRWLSSAPKKLGLWLRSYGSMPGYKLERGVSVAKTIEHAESLGLPEDMVNVNTNRIEYGDNVLASIPIEEYARRTKESIDRVIENIDDQKDSYLASESKGVKPFIAEPEEMEDKAAFHRREDRPITGQTGVGKSPAIRRKPRRAS